MTDISSTARPEEPPSSGGVSKPVLSPVEGDAGWYLCLDPWHRLAVVVWAAALVAICIRTAVWPNVHNCYPTYVNAARNWWAGVGLYGEVKSGLDPFRYSPLIAVVLTPFTVLPDPLGSALWRLLSGGAYLCALGWWSRAVLPCQLTPRQRGILFLLVAPLSIGNLNNGQTNMLMLSLLLCTVAAAAEDRWNVAAACAALASLFKIYPIALGLLLAVLYPRRFVVRLPLAFAVGLALPFLFERPEYVAAQYTTWVHRTLTEPRYGLMESWYCDFRMLWRVWLVPLDPRAYLALQLCVAAGIALICLAARRARWPRRHLLTLLVALCCCWMTTFGLSTESATYILLAPPLAWALLASWLEPQALGVRVALLISYGLLLSTQVAAWFPGMVGRVRELGPQPLGGMLLFGSALLAAFRHLSSAPHDRPVEPAGRDDGAPRA